VLRFARAARDDVMLREAFERNGARRVELDRGLHRRDREHVVAGAGIRGAERELERGGIGSRVSRDLEQIDRGVEPLALDEEQAEQRHDTQIRRLLRERLPKACLGLRELAAVDVFAPPLDELVDTLPRGGLLALHDDAASTTTRASTFKI
jgi:hypothetical protein